MVSLSNHMAIPMQTPLSLDGRGLEPAPYLIRG